MFKNMVLEEQDINTSPVSLSASVQDDQSMSAAYLSQILALLVLPTTLPSVLLELSLLALVSPSLEPQPKYKL